MSKGEPTRPAAPFDRLVWEEDRLLLGDLVFHPDPDMGIEQATERNLSSDALVLYKWKPHVGLYERAFSERRFHPQQILELGIWKGGSTALWFELFQPRKLVAVDIAPECTSEAFNSYVRTREAGGRLKPFWGVDQADSERLRQIVENEFDGPVDLIIDDASHLYGPTKASFETLFPRLRRGGLFCIEDWAWEHNCCCNDSPGDHEDSLTPLVIDLMRAVGTPGNSIRGITLYHPLAVVECDRSVIDPESFTLAGSTFSRFHESAGAEAVG
jgi:hypothetical protein